MSMDHAELCPSFTPAPNALESSNVHSLITKLKLQEHPEGGYYVETDRDPLRVPNPFQTRKSQTTQQTADTGDNDSTRAASTTIYYLLTPASPKGFFHMNKGRTIHTLHKGRGMYVVIHANEQQDGQKASIETFVVGHDIDRGERLQWLVEGGKYKASFLLPDAEGGSESEGLLISEVSKSSYCHSSLYCTQLSDIIYQTVVPGFEFSDHEFMPGEMLLDLVSDHQAEQMRWLLSEKA